MPISGMVVRINEDKIDNVVRLLTDLQGVTVSNVKGENLVVVTETDSEKQGKELWKQMEDVPGVLQVDLIYHNFEDSM